MTTFVANPGVLTMTDTSMTFGRPARLTVPRGSVWAASVAVALLTALRRLDRWLLGQRGREPQSPQDVLDWAQRIESTQPNFAADLRAAALRAMAQDDR
jgi:hypothetical protein